MADRAENGQFTAGNRAATVRKAKAAPGSTGVVAHAGFVNTGERDAALQGMQKWTTYANAFSRPPVAIAALLRYALMSGAKWTLVENAAGGREARRGVEIAQKGLLDATFESGTTWSEVVAKAGMYWFNGSSLHAFALGRRPDGDVGFTDLAHRPMHTVQRWLRAKQDDETTPFVAFEQRTSSGRTFPVDLSECLYLADHMLGDDPFGTGVLRLVVERIRRTGEYEALEGSELFSSLGGLPIARIPMEEIRDSVKHLPPDQQQAAIKAAYAAIETVVAERIKNPSKQMYLLLDSATFKGVDPNTITVIQKWAIEIVKAELQGLVEIRKVVTDLDLDVARVLGVTFAYVGGGDTKGTFSAHESMVGVFQASTQGGLDRIGNRATRQLLRRLMRANGLDPDKATPTAVPEKITAAAILDAAQLLLAESQAAAHPEDEAWDVLRERAALPKRPVIELQSELMAPRGKPPEDDEDDIENLEDDEDDEDIADRKPEKEPKADETKKRRR